MRKIGLRLVIGLLAATIGLVLMVQSPAKKAQAGTDIYVSNWKATSYLVAKRILDGNASDEIAIGVAGWEVKGSVSSAGSYFKEIWTAHQDYPAFTLSENPSSLIEWNRNGNINDFWLVGYVISGNVDRNRIEITKKGVGESIDTSSGRAAKVAGKTATCDDNPDRPSDCFYATGAYGFSNVRDWHKSQDLKNRSAGILMPIRWTVTGTICDDTEPECQ